MMGSPALFVCALLLLGVAHVVRAIRWALLFPPYVLKRRFTLLLGLGLGYAINAVLPFRLGELVRAVYVSRHEQVRLPLTLGTILAERVGDLVIIGLLILALGSTVAIPGFLWSAGLFGLLAAVGIALAIAVRASSALRQLIWKAASIFNDRVRVGIADLTWSTAELLAGGALLRWRYLVLTVAMWLLYGTSYYLAGLAIGLSVPDIGAALLQPFRSNLGGVRSIAEGGAEWWLLLFVVAPLLLILGYGAVTRRPISRERINFLLRHGRSGRGNPQSRRERFQAASSYESFLAALFSGADQKISSFGLEAIDDCVVHRLFNGGSDAITALVDADGELLIRKFALGAPAAKLKVQADWLRRHHRPDLPLAQVVGERGDAQRYSYDMPLVTPANDFYDVIHSASVEQSCTLLTRVVEGISTIHALSCNGMANPAAVEGYVQSKIVTNARTILRFAEQQLRGATYRLNDLDYDLREWDCLLDPDWLHAQMTLRDVGEVHGDLTIENIIVAPNEPHGFYVIDPNPENVFDTPLIDWAKLMQSLHLGYEALNRGIHVQLDGTSIQLAIARSQAYARLHQLIEAQALERFGPRGLREIYFHELVNYLRLTTYKIRQSEMKGLGFFACTSLLLRRYRQAYD